MRGIRAIRGNLDKVLKHAWVKEPDLADALCPTLERKIERALARGTAPNVPAVRVLHTAVSLTHEYPRRNLASHSRRAPASARLEAPGTVRLPKNWLGRSRRGSPPCLGAQSFGAGGRILRTAGLPVVGTSLLPRVER